MLVDVLGKVNNIKIYRRDALLPVFEAVVNSIQSIEENSDCNDGKIKIKIILRYRHLSYVLSLK